MGCGDGYERRETYRQLYGRRMGDAQCGGEWKPFPCAMYLVVKDVDGLYQKGVDHGATGNQEPGERGYGRSAGLIPDSRDD